jgi:PBP1b-binding outer membrane lipoprotein LpoB
MTRFKLVSLLMILLIFMISGCRGGGEDKDEVSPTATTYTVTYDANNATSGNVPIDSTEYKTGVEQNRGPK